MKKWFKRFIISLAVLSMIAIVGASVFLLTFDPNAYKTKLSDFVAARYHRTLTIDGEIELSLFPRLGLNVQGVSLSEAERPDVAFISLDSARVAVAIWPLLFKQLVVDHIAVDGFRAQIVRDAQGNFNFLDFLNTNFLAAKASLGDASVSPGLLMASGLAGSIQAGVNAVADLSAAVSRAQIGIDIAGLDFYGGEIFLRDEFADSSLHISDINANTGRITSNQPFDISLSAHIEGDKPRIDLNVSGRSLIKLDSAAMQYTAQRLDLQIEGDLPGVNAKRLRAQGNVYFDAILQSLNMSKLELAFQGDLTNRGITGLDASLVLPSLSIDTDKQRLELDGLVIRAQGALRDRSVDLSLNAPSLQLSATQTQGGVVTGHWRSSGEDALDARFLLTGLSGGATALEIAEVKLDGTFKQGDRLTTIHALSPLMLSFPQRTADFSAIQAEVNIVDAKLPKGALRTPLIGKLSADLRKAQVSTTLAAVLEEAAVDLELSIRQLFTQPQLVFSLAAPILDLDTLFVPAPISALAPALPSGQGEGGKKNNAAVLRDATSESETPFDFSLPMDVTARGTLNIGELRMRGLKASDVQATVRLENARLDIATNGTTFYQGKLAGSLFIDTVQSTSLGAKLTLVDASLAPLLHDLAGESRMRGRGNLSIDLRATGNTSSAWRQTLNGTVQAQARDGAIQGVNVAQALRAFKAALGNRSASEPDSLVRETDFSTFDADMLFSDGVGTVRKLKLTSPLFRVSQGSPARVNVTDNTLDLVLNVRVVNTSTGQSAKEFDVLKGFTIPVHVAGSLENPVYSVLWNQAGNATTRRALESRIKRSLLTGSDSNASSKRAVQEIGNALKRGLKP